MFQHYKKTPTVFLWRSRVEIKRVFYAENSLQFVTDLILWALFEISSLVFASVLNTVYVGNLFMSAYQHICHEPSRYRVQYSDIFQCFINNRAGLLHVFLLSLDPASKIIFWRSEVKCRLTYVNVLMFLKRYLQVFTYSFRLDDQMEKLILSWLHTA